MASDGIATSRAPQTEPGHRSSHAMQRDMHRRDVMNAHRVVVAAVLLGAVVAAGGSAAAQQNAPAAVPDLSGGWLRIDSGSGSFDGTAEQLAPAQLTAAGKAMVVRGDGRNVIGQRGAAGSTNQPNKPGEAYIV